MATYRIPNTYQTPIASALGNLMGAFASLPSPEERALKQAQVQNLQSQAALNQQKMADAAREAQYGGKITDVFRKVFTPVEDVRPNADFVGPIPEVPPDERVRRALPDLAGTLPPNQIGQLGDTMLALFANAPGTSNEAVTRAGIGAKVPYNSTQLGAEAERDRKIQLEDRKDQRAQQTALAVADRAAATQDRIDARQGKQVIGEDGNAYWYAPGMPYHGLRAPFAQQSGPLATDAVKARGQLDALNSFRQKGADFLGLARSAPDALGAAGTLRTVVSGAAEQAKALGSSLGLESVPGLVDQAQNFLRQQGVTVADPAVASKIAVYIHQLPYDAAAALAGQQGRSVTDNDVKRFARLLGETPITNLADLEARWQVINQMIDDEVARTQPRLNMRPTQPGTLAQPGLGSSVTNTFQQPAAAAPAAAPAASPGTSDPLGIRR